MTLYTFADFHLIRLEISTVATHQADPAPRKTDVEEKEEEV